MLKNFNRFLTKKKERGHYGNGPGKTSPGQKNIVDMAGKSKL